MVNFYVAVALLVLLTVGLRLLLENNVLFKFFGFVLLGHAINLILLLSGSTPPQSAALGTPAFAEAGRLELMVDPLPQALILTAIVIGFGFLALWIHTELQWDSKSEDPPQ